MSTNTSTRILLASRPEGWPSQENFRTETITLPDLEDGEIRVKNLYLSVDPYMRGRMINQRSYVPPFELDEPLTGGAIGRVIESRSSEIPVGSVVSSDQGWRDIAQFPAKNARKIDEDDDTPLSLYLGLLGMTGLTAYVGLTAIGQFKEGDTVFVTGAAGAVGSAVGQFAKLLGASRVVGSAGTDEKVRLLTEKYGFDAALNYKDAPVRDQLPELVPDGIDVFFDNVGADHLEAGLDNMADFGRIAMCGAIAVYNEADNPPGPDNLTKIIQRELTVRGFTLGHHAERIPEATKQIQQWFKDGKLEYDETITEGLENMVDTFINMMQGANTGKAMVSLPE